MATKLSPAFGNYLFFMQDIGDLIAIHDMVASRRERARKTSTPGEKSATGRNLDVLRRAGIILLVTAWETFVEDLLQSLFLERLQSAKGPNDMQGTSNTIADAWLEEKRRDSQVIHTPDLLSWAGEGWKKMISDRFDSELSSLHTPNSDNVRRFFRRYLGHKDITQHWQLSQNPGASAGEMLDSLIKRRGELVHRGSSTTVTKEYLLSANSLVQTLVAQTAHAMGISTGKSA